MKRKTQSIHYLQAYKAITILFLLLMQSMFLHASAGNDMGENPIYQFQEFQCDIYDLVLEEDIELTTAQNLAQARRVFQAPHSAITDNIDALSLYEEALSFYSQENYGNAIKYLTQAMEKSDKNNELRVWIYFAVGNCYLYIGEHEEAWVNYDKGLALLEDSDDLNARVHFLNNAAITRELLGEYPEAIQNYLHAKEHAEQIQNNKFSAWIIYNLGNVYYSLGDYQKALDYHLETLSFFQDMNNGKETARALTILALLYDQIGDKKIALIYYKRSYRFLEKIGSVKEQDQVLHNIAGTLNQLGDFKNALEYYLKAQELEQKSNEKERLTETLDNIGVLYLKTSDPETALTYHDKAQEMSLKVGDTIEQVRSLLHIGDVYAEKGEYEQAKKQYVQALQITQTADNQLLVLDSYKALFTVDQKLGLYESSYLYMTKYAELWDNICAKENENKILGLQTRYNIEKKERELSLLMKEQGIRKLKIKKYKMLSVLLIAVIINVVLLALAIRNRSRYKRHANVELKKRNQQLDALSKTDALTRLSNRRNIIEKIEYQQVAYERNGRPFTVLIADIDNFKKINDTFGHDAGDHILISLGNLIKDNIRKQDFVGRWGGDELILLLPDTPTKGGMILGEKIRTKVDKKSFFFNHHTLNTSLTIGVAEYRYDMGYTDLIKKADQALYNGKNLGKNCVMNFEVEVNEL